MIDLNENTTYTIGVGREQIAWFDYEEVDALLGNVSESSDEARAQAVEVLQRIMAWVWSGNGNRLQCAVLRFTALTAGLRPDLLENKTYLELGNELGVTKQGFSKAALKFSDAFQLKLARSRSVEARDAMSKAGLGHPNYRHRTRRTECDTQPANNGGAVCLGSPGVKMKMQVPKLRARAGRNVFDGHHK